jgi:hypothetical protein
MTQYRRQGSVCNQAVHAVRQYRWYMMRQGAVHGKCLSVARRCGQAWQF